MQSSDSKPLLEDYDDFTEKPVVDFVPRNDKRKENTGLLYVVVILVTGVLIYYSLVAEHFTGSQGCHGGGTWSSNEQNFSCFPKDSLGYRLKEASNQTHRRYSGLYNSFKEERKAFFIKLKVKLYKNELKIRQEGSAQVLELGKTQFRQSLDKKIRVQFDSESSMDYVTRRLNSPALSLKEEVSVSKYPAIREPPGSLRINSTDSSAKEYIYEYVGINPGSLLSRLIKDQIAISKEQLEQIYDWTQGDDSASGSGSLASISKVDVPDYELISIVNNGPPENRIDVVFMGDGYTQEERGKFIDDMTRLSTEMFEGETFKTWLPLINVWAAFVPSVDSGIGTGGKPKNTPFGLYRDGTELRGIYSSKRKSARAICNHLGYALCDFPSMIANDDYYGGLGGEYIISTRSILSGTVVLRHEMGHTFNDVGEEYDGGEVYEGVDASPNLNNIPWKHWLSDNNKFDGNSQDTLEGKLDTFKHTEIKEEKNALAIQDYSWHDLTKKGPYVLHFNSTGKYSRWYIQISTSGMATEGSFKAYLDGVELPWKAPGTLDRTFSTWFNGTHGLSKGSHQLRFEARPGLKKGKIIHQLCNVEMIEYAKEKKFNWKDPKHVGAYPTYDYKHRKTYRPTNEYCLMRNMTSTHFCPVCTEGLWLKFLDRVNLIDEFGIRKVRLPKSQVLSTTPNPHTELANLIPLTKSSPNYVTIDSKKDPKFIMGYLVEAKLVGLDPKYLDGYRKTPGDSNSQYGYTLHWYYNGQEIEPLAGATSFIVPEVSPYIIGVWDLEVSFTTPQVKVDPNHLLMAHQTFILKQPR